MRLDALLGEFDRFVKQFRRSYAHGSSEYMLRFELFTKTLQEVQRHNEKPDRLWTAGIGPLSDRTGTELALLRGWRGAAQPDGHVPAHRVAMLLSHGQAKAKAVEVDWRNLSMAKNVPDQGSCGSCWAVATTTMLEARHEVHKKEARSFSAQQLVNCVPNPQECGGQGGCGGATVELALAYVQRVGLSSEDGMEGVPYKGRDMACNHPMPQSGVNLNSLAGRDGQGIGMKQWYTLPRNKAGPLMLALQDGPVAIAASADAWNLYSSGVFNSCSKDAVVDHAVVAFGYGTTDGVKHWIVRNSWGDSWGEGGYIRVLRGDTVEADDALCGEDQDPAAGIACKPYPKSQTVCGMCGLLFDSVVVQF